MNLLYTVERQQPLVGGVLVKRYKRFLADVKLDDGRVVTAHCANTGSMERLALPGTRVWLEPVAEDSSRKLKWSWILAELDDGMYGVDTGYPNRMTGELLRQNKLPFLGEWAVVRPEQKYGVNSRVVFLLENPVAIPLAEKAMSTLYLEIKNCHLRYPDGYGYFPDSTGARATKHLHELSAMAAQSGVGSAVMFFAQVPHLVAVRPSDVHDAEFASVARDVARGGVRFFALKAKHSRDCTEFYGPIPVDLAPYDVAPILAWRQQWKSAATSK